MWNRLARSILVGSAGLAATGACAMTAPVQAQSSCRVHDAARLPAEAGGADAICGAVARAAAAKAPSVRYNAEIRVVSRSSLAAELTADGRKLPEQRFSVSDRDLNPLAIEHFADALAAALADARKS